MAAFDDMQDLLVDFLTEATDLLENVDLGLVELEQRPGDHALLNQIFRGFHTVKGGAGFLEATALVELCHRGENLLDLLRGSKLQVNAEIMDLILAATAEVRRMFGEMSSGMMPTPAPEALLRGLEEAAEGKAVDTSFLRGGTVVDIPRSEVLAPNEPCATLPPASNAHPDEPDWALYYHGLLGDPPSAASAPPAPVSTHPPKPAAPRPSPAPAPAARPPAAPVGGAAAASRENTIRVDTVRFDQILTLSGEIGLTKNRLNVLRGALLLGQTNEEVRKTVDAVFGQLDSLVSDLQTAVMKARMQPVGRVFQKYQRLARDLARQLGKDVELVITGAETEVDKTILEELNDPLVHLVRNAVDHGVEPMAVRKAMGKPERGTVHIAARQTGDSIVIEISDDGKGMDPEVIRRKAIEKGAISAEDAGVLDPKQCLQLIFLPGFSTKTEITDVSGRGVGMDVVKTNIERLKGRIDIHSAPGQGSRFIISLPLTLAILPVLMLKLEQQVYALPLSSVQEIIPIDESAIQPVNNQATMMIRGEVLPLFDLAQLIGRPRQTPAQTGVVAFLGERGFILGCDGFVGQDEVMIKPLEGVHPKGVAGATLSGDGTLVLVLEMKELLDGIL
jgi:two-component system chemotaxis sensor kinase CheA